MCDLPFVVLRSTNFPGETFSTKVSAVVVETKLFLYVLEDGGTGSDDGSLSVPSERFSDS